MHHPLGFFHSSENSQLASPEKRKPNRRASESQVSDYSLGIITLSDSNQQNVCSSDVRFDESTSSNEEWVPILQGNQNIKPLSMQLQQGERPLQLTENTKSEISVPLQRRDRHRSASDIMTGSSECTDGHCPDVPGTDTDPFDEIKPPSLVCPFQRMAQDMAKREREMSASKHNVGNDCGARNGQETKENHCRNEEKTNGNVREESDTGQCGSSGHCGRGRDSLDVFSSEMSRCQTSRGSDIYVTSENDSPGQYTQKGCSSQSGSARPSACVRETTTTQSCPVPKSCTGKQQVISHSTRGRMTDVRERAPAGDFDIKRIKQNGRLVIYFKGRPRSLSPNCRINTVGKTEKEQTYEDVFGSPIAFRLHAAFVKRKHRVHDRHSGKSPICENLSKMS
jgi:hypothetical protein